MYRFLFTFRILHFCFLYLLSLLCWSIPNDAYAQVGVRLPYLNSGAVQFSELEIPSYGIGVDSLSNIPIPKNALSITRSTRFDTLSNKYIITEDYYGDQYKIPLILDREDVISVNRQWQLERLWYESSTKTINSYRAQQNNSASSGGGGLNLRIPVPLQSQRLDRLVGGGGAIGLQVTGEVNITGNLLHNDRSEVKDVFKGSDYTFKLQQTQRFNITGKVGEKISVQVDQDSERDFDIQNNMRLFYTGEEDEIFQSIQAGNISLALPGTQFITFSGGNKGLFGFKVVNKLGPIDMTSVASMERGEKKSLILENGAQAIKSIKKDYEYLRGVYFFVDTQYRDAYRFNQDGLPIITSDLELERAEVWMSDRNSSSNPDSKEGWAVLDPNNLALEDTLSGGSQNAIRRFFKRLRPNIDYQLNLDMGRIIMERPIRNEVLAIAYKPKQGLEPGFEVGDLEIPEDRPIILKLLRTDNPQPTDSTWTLEWRNVYDLGQQGISHNGFSLQIVLSQTETRDPALSDGTEFIEVFGLDRTGVTGQSGADGLVDVARPFFNFTRGHLIMPGLRPFDPVNNRDPLQGNRSSSLPEENQIPGIYDKLFPNPSDYNSISQFEFEYTLSSQSQTHNLGFNIIPESEEVLLDGRLLLKGEGGYQIDYSFGQITILDSMATQPGSRVEVRYESSEIFRLDKKTLLGTHLDYNLGDIGFIGGTALFLNERIIDTKVNIGQEPKKNMTWGVNSSLKFNAEKISSMLDKLPVISATAPTQFSFEGEFAQTRPNPNTLSNGATLDPKGVAYIDDFEGTKRLTSLGIMRRTWTISSLPKFKDTISNIETQLEQQNRAKMLWFNPFRQVDERDILENKQIGDLQNPRVNIMNIEFVPNSRGIIPDNAWGGIMKWLGTGSFNQSESKFIEMWIKGEKGKVTIDLGQISEDAVPNKTLDTEDGINSMIPNDFDKILDDAEDVGIWSKWNETNLPEVQWDDEFHNDQETKIFDDHRYVNGTKNNRNDGSRIPDTEDIDADGILDPIDKYFQLRIDLGNDAISGKYKVSGPNENGWNFYRIPLADFWKIGDPSLSQIEYSRLWFTDLEENEGISIYKIELVGSAWKELGVAANDEEVEVGNYTASDTTIVVDAVNTEDDKDVYIKPPGVTGEFDKLNDVHGKEQSLALKFFRLLAGQSGAMQTVFPKAKNLIHYRRLKMFVFGGSSMTELGSDDTGVELFFQFGYDNKNYYEIRKKIKPGWDDNNHINVDLWEIPKLKTTTLADSTAEDTLQVDVREFDNGDIWKVVGNPSLQNILKITVGVKNIGDFSKTGFVWLDEMRVSGIDRAPGNAFRTNINLNLSSLGTISTSFARREANFHTINEQFGSLQNTNNFSLYFRNFSLGSIIPQLNMFNIPLNYSMTSSDATPKYLKGSDILFSASDPNVSREEIHSKSVSYSSGFSVRPFSENWLIKSTIQAFNLSFTRQETDARDVNTEFIRSTKTAGKLSYKLGFGKPLIRPFWFLPDVWGLRSLNQFRFFYMPGGVSTSLSVNESVNEKKLRIQSDSGKITKANTFTAAKTITTSYTPINNLTFNFSHQTSHDLSGLNNKLKLFSAILEDSTVISTQQTVGTKYSPNIMQWLSPSLGYNVTYGLAKNKQSESAGNSATSNRTLSSGVSLSLNNLVGLVYNSPRPQSPTSRRPPPRRAGQTEDQQEPQEESQDISSDAESGGFPVNPLWYLDQFTKRIAPISVNFNQARALQNVGLDGKPGLGYQFGLDVDPGVEIKEGLGQNTGTESNQAALNMGSSIAIARVLNFTMRYTNSSTITDNQNTKTGKDTQSMFIIGDTRIPLFEYGLQFNNLHEFPYINKVADNVSLTHNYSGSHELNWQETEDNLLNERFQWGFAPVAGLRILWKKGINSLVTMNQNTSLVTDNKTSAETKILNSDISVNTSFQWTSGFRISIPFTSIKSREIKNSVNFNVDFRKTNATTFEKRGEAVDFSERNKTNSWSVTPRLVYSFTSHVTGSMNFKYQVNESKQTGKNVTKDFGLSIRIRIAG